MSKNSLLTGLILLTLILPLSNATTDPWFELDTDEDGFENGIDLCPNTASSSNQFNQTTCSHTNHWIRQDAVENENHHRIGVGRGFEFEISPDQKYLAFKDNEHEKSDFDIFKIDDMSGSLKEGDSQKKAKSFVFSKNSSVMYTTDGTYLSIYELNNSIWSLRESQFEIDLGHLCVSWQCIDQMEMTENGSHILLTTKDVYGDHRYCGFAMLNIMSFQIDMNYNLTNSTRQFACNNAPFISSTVNGSLVFSISGGSGIEIHDLTGSKNTSIILENTSNSDGIIAHSTNGKLFAHVADGPPGTFQKSIQIRHLNNLTLVSELYIHYSELGYFEFSPDSTNLVIHSSYASSDNARFMITSNGSMMFTDSFNNLTFFDIYKNTTTTFSQGKNSGRDFVVFGADRDNDMVADINDAFPMDAREWLDTDVDGVGDNSDSDDDDDGWSDSDENNCSTNSKDLMSVPLDTDADMICDIQDSNSNVDSNSDEEDLMIGIFGCLIPLLICSSIIFHKPTFNKTVKLIGKLPMTNQLVESLESARENIDGQENPTLDTDSLVGLIAAPFILMGYAIYFSLIVAFYGIMLYLAVSAAFLILIGSAAFMCFLLPFFLLLGLSG
jgi:hypothetical protein|tara:strand:- start:87 stop:1919 length:1833 start_codon:yes stop_codon:yes gene_type:complete